MTRFCELNSFSVNTSQEAMAFTAKQYISSSGQLFEKNFTEKTINVPNTF